MPAKKLANPFSVNFRQLQRYNFSFFSLEEIVLFEYLMVLAQGFDYKQFYHSTTRITKETGIKRSRMEATFLKFAVIGLLGIEVKGFPLVKHFTIQTDFILQEFDHIFQFGDNHQLHDETYKLFADIHQLCVENSAQEKLNKETNKATKKEIKDLKKNSNRYGNFSFTDAVDFVNRLEMSWNQRREYLSAKTKKRYPPVTLGFKNNKTFEVARQALNEREIAVMENAWMVMCDQVTKEGKKVKKLLPYFFSLKEGEFNVIDAFADIHNVDYTYTSNG